MQHHQPKVLALGSPFFDRFAFVDDDFLKKANLIKGDTSLTDDVAYLERIWNLITAHHGHDFKLGGSAVNVIKVLANLGIDSSLCGKIGFDEKSEKLLQRLTKIGISSYLKIGEKSTGRVNCFVTKDKERTMLTYLGAAQELSESDITLKIFEGISHFHVEGYSACYGKCLEKSIQLAKTVKATISIDLSSQMIVKTFKNRLFDLLKNVDIVFSNNLEMQMLQEGINIDSEFVNQTIIVTNGAHGCSVKESGKKEFTHYNALKVTNVVDTTGAGDYFDGGFLYGFLNGKTTAECVSFGNMAASAVIQELGADLPSDKWFKDQNFQMRSADIN